MTTTHTAQSTAGRTSLNQQKGASAGWCFGPDTPCMGWLSVKLITAMLCLVAIACSSVVASVVLIGSCDNALDSTRSTTIASIQDFFATSSEGLEKVTNDLVGFTSLAIKGRVYSYLTPYVMHVQRISYHVVVSEANESKGNMTWLYKQRSLVYDAARLLGQNGLYNAGFLVGPNYSLFCQPKDTSGPYNEHTFEMSILNGTGGTRYEVDAKGEPIMDKFTNAPLGGANVFLMGPASHGILNENEVIWSNVVDSYKFSGLSVTFNYKDPVSSQWMMYMVLLHLDDISRFLSDITRETQEKTNAVLRVYTAVATNLYANRYLTVDMDEALRAIVLRIQNSTYKLTGVSHGLASLLPLSATPADRNSSKGLYDIEATDPLIRAVADRLQQEPGRYDGKLAGVHAITVDPQPTAQEWMGRFYSTSLEEAGITPGPQRHYVQVSRLQDDMGLDWWVTTTIDAEYISGEIRRSYSASRAVMEVEKAEVEDEIQADRLVATMILIGVAVLLVFLASGAVYRVFEPLRTLQLEMGHVAEMNLSILQDPTRRTYSAMSEVRRMQKNFLTMARRLDEFRAFVPGAVLEGKQVSQVPPPRGVVAMVFTDIVESTALWELNSEGMDTALEMHNLLMRATLKQFDGYEVKTIGDSFMIAFDDVVNAVNFCLTTQLRLRNEPWPMELRLTPGWGLKVRMGCHCGEVGVEKNPLTGRTDYRGGCVNMAARLENRALHGTLCLASATIEALREKGVTMQGLDAKALPAGVHDLKGLGEHALYNVVPIALAERLGGSQHTATVVGFVSEKKSSVPESTSASGKDANDGYRMKRKRADNGNDSDNEDEQAVSTVVSEFIETYLVKKVGVALRLSSLRLLIEEVMSTKLHKQSPILMRCINEHVTASKLSAGEVKMMAKDMTLPAQYRVESKSRGTQDVKVFGVTLRNKAIAAWKQEGHAKYALYNRERGRGRPAGEATAEKRKLAASVEDESRRKATRTDSNEQSKPKEKKKHLEELSAKVLGYATSFPDLRVVALKETAGWEGHASLILEWEGEQKVIGCVYCKRGSQKTGLFLSSGPVSVVVCKMTAVEMVFDKFNSLFRGAAEAAEQTEGVVGSVTGNCLQLNWNSSKPCRMHVTAALHFAAGLEERLSGFARLGVSSGNVMHGNVGSKSHRSHTILGKPLDAAFAMADLAQSLSTFAMVADCTPQLTMLSIPAVAHSVRLFDYWSLPDQAAIMQLLCGHLLKHTWDQTLESGPVYRHNKLCPAAMAGDATALDELVVRATAAPEDIVLNALVNNLSVRNRHRDPNSGNLVVTFSLIPPGAMPDFSTPNAMTAVVAQ
ncbi:Adenylate cyclase [Diplonema papillatum]|nr:Adenylate cyclase [Diplonema papillatum]